MSKLKDYKAVNEPVLSYFKNSAERKLLKMNCHPIHSQLAPSLPK